MSSIIYITKNNNKYAYESISYRDPNTKKPRTKRKYLGKVDPDTGEIIPKAPAGRRNRKPSKKQEEGFSNEASQKIALLNEQVKNLQHDVLFLTHKTEASDRLVQAIIKAVNKYQEASQPSVIQPEKRK